MLGQPERQVGAIKIRMPYTAGALATHLAGQLGHKYLAFSNSRVVPFLESIPFFADIFPRPLLHSSVKILTHEEANVLISALIASGKPSMIGRFGESELRAVLEFELIDSWSRTRKILWKVVLLKSAKWTPTRFLFLASHAGFFPTGSRSAMRKFCEVMRDSSKSVDLLGSWVRGENLISELQANVEVTELDSLKPFSAPMPWTRALQGKRVLVIHPFTDSIRSQYRKRKLLFPSAEFLPQFDLRLIKCPQTVNDGVDLASMEFNDWFGVLESIKVQIRAEKFDVAIIGAGAYGFALASFVKSLGFVAIHFGGATQLLFGIWGNRWNTSEEMLALRNSHWVRPLSSETPELAPRIEGAAYW